MTEPADLKSADLISLAMGRYDDRCPIANSEQCAANGQRRGGFHQFARLCLPHLCLSLLIALYILFVALIMRFVEAQNEHEEQIKMGANIERMRANFILHFFNKPIILGGDLEAESRKFVDRMLRIGWTHGRAGVPLPASDAVVANGYNNRSLSSSAWTMPDALLFATSLVSRIGYGHLVPRTPEGKMLCQLFALIGCPLFLLLIADIGKSIANLLHFLLRSLELIWTTTAWKRASSKKCPPADGGVAVVPKCVEDGPRGQSADECRRRRRQFDIDGRRLSPLFVLPILIAFCAFTTVAYAHLEGWNWLDCFYFSFISFYAIGFGDFAPSNACSVAFTMCAIVIGMSIATLFVDIAGTEYIRNIHRIENTVKNGCDTKCCGRDQRKRGGKRRGRSKGRTGH